MIRLARLLHRRVNLARRLAGYSMTVPARGPLTTPDPRRDPSSRAADPDVPNGRRPRLDRGGMS